MRVAEFRSVYVGRNEGVSKLRIADLVKAAIAVFEIAARYRFMALGHLRKAHPPNGRWKALKQIANLQSRAPGLHL